MYRDFAILSNLAMAAKMADSYRYVAAVAFAVVAVIMIAKAIKENN